MSSLIRASAIGWFVALILLLLQRIVSLDQANKAWVEGVKDILEPTLVLILAWALGSVISDLNTAAYIASLVQGQISQAYLPAIASVLCYVVSFATGSSFGAMAIMLPIVTRPFSSQDIL